MSNNLLTVTNCCYKKDNFIVNVQWKIQNTEVLKNDFKNRDYFYSPVLSVYECRGNVRRQISLRLEPYQPGSFRIAKFLPNFWNLEAAVYQINESFVFDFEFSWPSNLVVQTCPSLANDLQTFSNQNDLQYPTNLQLSLRCKNKQFQIPKYILLCRSPIFQIMFQGSYIEAQKKEVEIPDFEPEIVEKMIEFCETDKIDKTDGDEIEIYKIARKYQIEALMIYTYNLMINTLSFENVSDRLQTAFMYDDEKLAKFLCASIIPNIEHIRFTPGFLKLTNNQIAQIFKSQ